MSIATATMFNRRNVKAVEPKQLIRLSSSVRNSDTNTDAFVEGRGDIEISSRGQDLTFGGIHPTMSSRVQRTRKKKVPTVPISAFFAGTLVGAFLALRYSLRNHIEVHGTTDGNMALGSGVPELRGSHSLAKRNEVHAITEDVDMLEEASRTEFRSKDDTKTSDGDDERWEALPLPQGWEEFGYKDIRYDDHFDCKAHSRDRSQPLHTLEEWQYMRKKYNEAVEDKVIFNDAVPPTLGYVLEDNSPPPFYAKLSPGKGRGIFASRDIKKGELVHVGKNSAVIFPDAMAWRRFVFSLPRDMACNIAMWSWTQKLPEEEEHHILVDLNISAFFNNGGKHSNVMPKSTTSLNFYAAHDIKKDTELMYDYSVYKTKWYKVGL